MSKHTQQTGTAVQGPRKMSRPFLPVNSATKLHRRDVPAHPIQDYSGLRKIAGTMDATIRVNRYSGKNHQ